MKVYPENPITYRVLYNSPILKVDDYRCHRSRGGPAAEERSGINGIVLMRHGAFCKHFGRRNVTAADVNQAVFFSKGSTYRVSHPADHGDRGAVFVLSSTVLNDIIRELDPSIDDHPEQPFPFVTGPCDSGVFWRHRELVQRKVVMLGYYDGVPKATGKKFQAQVAHIWTIAAGKAVKFQQYTDTHQLAESVK